MNENEKPLKYFADKAKTTYEAHRKAASDLTDTQEWAETDVDTSFAEKRARIEYVERANWQEDRHDPDQY